MEAKSPEAGSDAVPADAVWEACFGFPTSDESFAAGFAGTLDDAIAAIATAAASSSIVLPSHAPREGCRLPENLVRRSGILKEALSEAARLARLDRYARDAWAGDNDRDSPHATIRLSGVPRASVPLGASGRARLVREALGMEGEWVLPTSAGLTLTNMPGDALFRAEVAFVDSYDLRQAALDVALEIGHRSSIVDLCSAIGPEPEGVSLRIAAGRKRRCPSIFARLCQSWLVARAEEAMALLPRGRITRSVHGHPVTWNYAARTPEPVAAALARLSGPGPGHLCQRLAVSGPFLPESPLAQVALEVTGEDDGRDLASILTGFGS